MTAPALPRRRPVDSPVERPVDGTPDGPVDAGPGVGAVAGPVEAAVFNKMLGVQVPKERERAILSEALANDLVSVVMRRLASLSGASSGAVQ